MTKQQNQEPEEYEPVDGPEELGDIDDYIDDATPELLERQQRAAQRVDSGGVIYKFKDGNNRLRLMPAKKGAGYAFFAVRQHWTNFPKDDGTTGPKPFLCLEPTGIPCPLCDLAAQMQQDPGTAEEGKRMEARPVYIYNVLDMSDVDAGPKVAMFGWEAHAPIKTLWDLGENPCDYQNGPVFNVLRFKRGRVTYQTTALSARYPIPVSALKAMHDLRKYAAIPSKEQLELAVGVLTGLVPPDAQATYKPGLANQRPALGSRAETKAPPPRRTVASALRDD